MQNQKTLKLSRQNENITTNSQAEFSSASAVKTLQQAHIFAKNAGLRQTDCSKTQTKPTNTL